jgi:hypothetical protein
LREELAGELPRWTLPDCLPIEDIAKTTVG